MQGSCQSCKVLRFLACHTHFFATCNATDPNRRESEKANQLAIRAGPRHQIVTFPANCGQSPLALRDPSRICTRKIELAYKMIAERDNETVKIERTSNFIIVAKARIWASEGWQVVITDADGKSYQLAEFDQLLAA
jgi:hypothetical protein